MIDPTQMGGMMGGPPPDLSGLAGGPLPPAGPTPDASVSSPPKGDASDLLRQVVDILNLYLREETDDADLARASKIQAEVQALLADQVKAVDQATGAGPGARILRKAAPQGY